MFEEKKNRIFNNRFFIKKRLSAGISLVYQGSFGIVFLCQDLQNKSLVAMKVEKEDVNHCLSLEREIQMLEELRKIQGMLYQKNYYPKGVPKLIWAGNEHGHNCMVIQLLGKDLAYHMKNLKKFSLKTVVNIAIQIIHILENVHKKGIIHRDMKPENIVTGRDQEINMLYLVDYGISKFYREPNGKHIPNKEGKAFAGTTRYASLATHQGQEISRKDDLESLGYMLVYLFRGFLPWQNVNNANEKEKAKLVGVLKQKTTVEELCIELPPEFREYFYYLKTLKFQDTPDYGHLISLFEKVALSHGFKNDKRLDWIETNNLTTTKVQTNDFSQNDTKLGKQDRNKLSEKNLDQKSNRNRSRHASESSVESVSQQNTLQQSSILINYQHSQLSQQNLKMGSSKLVQKIQERFNPKVANSRGSISNLHSQASLNSSKQQNFNNNSNFQVQQEDFYDLEELELKLQRDRKTDRQKNAISVKVKEVHDPYQIENTNLTTLNQQDDDEDEGISSKIQNMYFTSRLKEGLKK